MRFLVILLPTLFIVNTIWFMVTYETMVEHEQYFKDAKIKWETYVKNCQNMYEGACELGRDSLDFVNGVLYWMWFGYIGFLLVENVVGFLLTVIIYLPKKGE